MARPESQSPQIGALAPFHASLPRVMVEAGAGYGVLLLAGTILYLPRGTMPLASAFLVALAELWLVGWPAWRIYKVAAGRWWTRLIKGVLRSLLVSILLGSMGVLLYVTVTGLANSVLIRPERFQTFAAVFVLAFLFTPLRGAVLIYGWLTRRIQRHLRWQLMASNVAVVVLTFATMAAAFSLVIAVLLVTVLQPDQRRMAIWVAAHVPRAGTSIERRAGQTMLDEIEQGTLQVEGEPFLASLIPRGFAPSGLTIADMNGRPLAQAQRLRGETHQFVNQIALTSQPRTWHLIRRHALLKQSLVVVQPPFRNADVIASAPIIGPGGHPIGVAIVQAPTLGISQVQFLAISLFGAGTIVLIIATALPVLAISALLSYLVARGLTRGLESVSRVTTAIASGDLSQRAPRGPHNEIGALADDVNRMAAHLDTTMGELHQARTQAENALRTREELVANISHELRTPLAVLRAHLETLAMHPAGIAAWSPSDDSEVSVPERTLRALRLETERLASLIDDLFALSRVETGGLEVHLEPTDVASIVDEVATLMRPLARSEGMVTLLVESPVDLPPATADGSRLRQILANLVRNAVRHTPEGGIVVLSVESRNDWIVMSVADTGEGIPADHLPHIFERFYRVDAARSRDCGGSGLGLAIVREFVELMGGRVTAESISGEGSRFNVYLRTALSA